MTTYWYIDPRIAPGDESDAYDGGYGVGKLRDSWDDVTFALDSVNAQACDSVFNGTITLTLNGSAKNIILRSYGTGAKPLIRATGAFGINSNAFGSHIYRDLEIEGGTTACINAVGSAIEVNNCTIHGGDMGVRYVTSTVVRNGRQVIGCTIYDCPSGAIRDSHGSGTNIVHTNTLIEGNTIYDCGPGIYMFASKQGNAYAGMIIRNNTIRGSGGLGMYIRGFVTANFQTPPDAYLESIVIEYNDVSECDQGGIQLGEAITSRICNNRVYRVGIGENTSTDTLGGIHTFQCTGLIVDDNVVHDVYTPDIDGVGIFDDQANDGCKFRRNRVWNCYGLAGVTLSGIGLCSYRSTDSVIESNLFYGNKIGLAAVGEDTLTSGQFWYNNTITANRLWGGYLGRSAGDPEPTDVTIKNNIFWGNSTADVGGASEDLQISEQCAVVTLQENCIGTADVRAPTTIHANNRRTDPLLSGSYGLLPGSPEIQAGVHIDYTRRDINKRQRPNPPSGGAFDVATLMEVL